MKTTTIPLLAAALLVASATANAPCSLPFQRAKADPAKGPYVSHNAPLASFRQPRESLDRLKGFARGVKGHVGNALGGAKQRWAERRAARRAAREEEAAAAAKEEGKGAKKKVGFGWVACRWRGPGRGVDCMGHHPAHP
jgi:hypothetical protein